MNQNRGDMKISEGEVNEQQSMDAKDLDNLDAKDCHNGVNKHLSLQS